MNRRKKIISGSLILFGLTILWVDTSHYDAPSSTQTILDRHHKIIGSINTAHQGFEFWTPLSEIPQSIIDATLTKEDRYFRWHPGINPIATLKALGANLFTNGGLRGGSTLTQQLAKILLQDGAQNFRTRSLTHKMGEAILALGLELKHSKNWILERYLNSAYYGSHCYGILAAAKYYFNKNLPELNSQEIALLINLPQNPAKAKELIGQPLGNRQLSLARHFIEWVAKNNSSSVIETTLDLDLQKHVEVSVLNLLKNRVEEDPLLNIGIVVIDVPSGELRALVGSRDYLDKKIGGTYNTALALRQPGSALKPFTYFLAFSKGYTPDSLVRDEPHSFTSVGDPFSEAYVPQNFDRHFHGEMTFRSALANSYNMPAVQLLGELGVSTYLDLLHQFGLRTLNKPPQYYGLSLTLGSGEVTLLDLTNAYAALARGGFYQPLTTQLSAEKIIPKEIIPQSKKYADLITDILTDASARIPSFGFNEDLLIEGKKTAVKTGTSYNHNDNWAMGYDEQSAVGVWLGHSDNSPLDGTTGASGAGPIWHAVMEHLVRRGGTPAIEVVQAVPSIQKTKSPELIKPITQDLFVAGDWNIISPLANNFYRLKPYLPIEHQQILAKISGKTSDSAQWYLDNVLLGSSNDNKFWISPTKGEHVLEVVSNNKRKQVHFHVGEDS